MIPKYLVITVAVFLVSAVNGKDSKVGHTEITKWQYGKKAAVSLTYDDGTINQFRVAMPLMDKLGFPGTFFVITGAVEGSEYEPGFIGRPVEEIIAGTAGIPTNKNNFFERASAVRFLGLKGTYQYHTRAGGLYERGRIKEAYNVIDEAYKRVRNGEFEPTNDYSKPLYDVLYVEPGVDLISWEELKRYAQNGHEIGSHTIYHPYLAVLDSANILHELIQSKKEILNHLGPEHTFSAECPFGTEDERVMEYAYDIYPALRNRMPRPWLEELNRSSDEDPGASVKEYVQWQRGPLSDTSMDLMKSWIDTSLEEDNIWLVLVIHGVEGIGWEPLSEEELQEYFSYIKEREDKLWVATFGDVTKYIRERMNAEVNFQKETDQITVQLSHSLDKELYDLPLTLKTYVRPDWTAVKVTQGDRVQQVQSRRDEKGTFVLYQVVPNEKLTTLAGV